MLDPARLDECYGNARDLNLLQRFTTIAEGDEISVQGLSPNIF